MRSATIRSQKWYWKSKRNRNRKAKNVTKRKLKIVAEGKCYRCEKDRTGGSTKFCSDCLKLKRDREKLRRSELAESGLCCDCSESIEPDSSSPRCNKCKKARAEDKRRLRNAAHLTAE